MSSQSSWSRHGSHSKRASGASKHRAFTGSANTNSGGKIGRHVPLEESSDNDSEDGSHFQLTIHRNKSPPVASSPPAATSTSRTASGRRSDGRKRKESRGKSPTRPRNLMTTDTAEEALANDDWNPDDDNLPPTIKELSSLCWKCHVTLRMPNSERSCWYAMHVHPILQVPVCSVCSEEIAFHQCGDTESDDELCHGCAEDAEEGGTNVFLLCDRCPRQFCRICVAQAYGGGREGLRRVEQLVEEDGDWFCLVCTPPPALKELQQELEEDAGVATSMQQSQDSTNSHDNSRSTRRRSVEEILLELDWAEAEMRNSQELFDERAIEADRKEIVDELRKEHPNLSPDELESMVEDELKMLNEQHLKHCERIGDLVASLQEEIEVGHDMDLSKVYNKCLGESLTIGQDAGEGDEAVPEWKRSADEAIRLRDAAENRTIQDVSSPAVYKESYVDVEDLMTKDSDRVDRDCLGGGFRSTSTLPTQREMELVLEMEDEMLAKNKICIRRKVDNENDVLEEREEEMATSQQGSDGVSRVRRDVCVTLKARSKKKAQTPPPQSRPENCADEVVAHAALDPPVKPADGQKFPPRASKPKLVLASASRDMVDLTFDESPVQQRKNFSFKGTEGYRYGKSSDVDYDSNKDAGDCERIPDDEYYFSTEPIYRDSKLLLSSPDLFSSDLRVKTIAVTTDLEKHMKAHQKEGVQFMWRNVCKDLNVRTSNDQDICEKKDIGGCILAHSMGLGKSLATIALLHTLLNHPSLVDQKRGCGLVRTALLVVPVNTEASWRAEFKKWTNGLQPSMLIWVLSEMRLVARSNAIDQWISRGGVLIVSKDSFARAANANPVLRSKTDIVVVDEAHLALSNSSNVLYKALDCVETKRRILLTGSPFQNNALEYFRMVQWIRPEALACTEAEFATQFAKPIMAGLPSDASVEEKKQSSLKSKELNNILSPYVHRKDEHVLREFLPSLTQAVIHVRQTKIQANLYKALKRHEDSNGITNYLKRFNNSRPIHNHPACLLMKSKQEDSSEDPSLKMPWWQKTVDKIGEDNLRKVKHGAKMIILLHILTHSVQIGDKVVVFTNCLKSLDFIEEMLRLPRWTHQVRSLKRSFPNTKVGGWTKGVHYFRLDGQTDGGTRGILIEKFNKDANVKLFLISRAGNVGITLTAANRVVLLDSHFNPTVTTQALFRCYRFGQTKPVYAYRLLSEGTGEEKIYSRSVNKTGLAMRVVDDKNYEGAFTQDELCNMVLNDTWAQCDRCEKWRMLKGQEEDLPDKWYCELNANDCVNNNCDASEKDARWYHKHFQIAVLDVGGGVGKDADMVAGRHQYKVSAAAANDDDWGSTVTDDVDAKKELMTSKDEILTKLLEDCTKSESKTAANISKYYFHEALLEQHEGCDASLLAAMEEVDAAEDLKPTRAPFARDGKEASPPRNKNATFDTKLEARKSTEPSPEAPVRWEASNGSATSGKAGKRRSTDLESAETEDGADGWESPKKRPAKEMPTAASLAVVDNADSAGKKLPAEPTAHISAQHNEEPKIKAESPTLLVSPREKRKPGSQETHNDTNSASLPSRRRLDPNDTQQSSLSAGGSRRKESSSKKSEPEVIDISSDEE